MGESRRCQSGEQFAVPADQAGQRRLSPTDLSQFIRLEQCRRYLRLRLHERAEGRGFLRRYGVAPQAIPPLLTRAGADFEATVEAAVRARFPVVDHRSASAERPADNAAVVGTIVELPASQVLVLLQPRLEAAINGWLIRGDVDLLRLERHQDGALDVLIADIKSSRVNRLEHRLQVAFYRELLAALLRDAGVAVRRIDVAVLYRAVDAATSLPAEEQRRREQQREQALDRFGVAGALLDIVDDPESLRDAVMDLVTGDNSLARRVSQADFDAVPFHLSYKCDGCLYNEFCLKWCAERDDLSLLPHLTALDKGALQRAGIGTNSALALLRAPDGQLPAGNDVSVNGSAETARSLAASWPVGPRLDELIARARRYRRWKGDPLEGSFAIPDAGYGSLPYSDEQHNPNLVTIYIDAQHDYLQDRIYLIGSLVVAHQAGQPVRRRSLVRMTSGPPETAETEERLLLSWAGATLRAVVELAEPDEAGQRRAPIHLVFFNRYDQRLLLDALARHFETLLGATALYDFMTQLAAFDSPLASFLDDEIRRRKNYPMVCQSLQAVAAHLGFDWQQPEPYRRLFRARQFDFWGKLDANEAEAKGESPWYFSRARFSSQIPLEYAYAAWRQLPAPLAGQRDELAPFRAATASLLRRFQGRRLAALEHVARDFRGNQQTTKTCFDLPSLAQFAEKASNLADALDEFVTIERHVELSAWKATRQLAPERRALLGETLIGRFLEDDQDEAVLEALRECARRASRRAEYLERAAAEGRDLNAQERKDSKWSLDGLRIRLRLTADELGCDLDELLGLTTLREGQRLVLSARWTADRRLPPEEQVPFTPTPKQLLYRGRAWLSALTVERDDLGRTIHAEVELELTSSYAGSRGFGFPSSFPDIPEHGLLYTLDPDPNDWYGYSTAKVTDALRQGARTALYERLAGREFDASDWPVAARDGQHRFLQGLDALHAAGALHPFEPSKRAYIGSHGEEPVLLVQGPPGTGKSYATAFAVLARLQGALAAGLECRVLLSCKTHVATDVLLSNLVEVQRLLGRLASEQSGIFARYFDRRLLDLPLFRLEPRVVPLEPVIGLSTKADPPDKIAKVIAGYAHCVVAGAPGGSYNVAKQRDRTDLFRAKLCHLLVLDEASQLSLPEAIMASLLLRDDGRLIVVGDPRQMPPIVKHDWSTEPRRTFREFRTYESLFLALAERNPPMIKFEESFRLHADIAAYLREEIYAHDQIPYFSRRHEELPALAPADPFLASVLAPEHPLVVVVHDETASQLRNAFEQELIAPIVQALADPSRYGLDARSGLGVVVPHRAQRAALQEAIPELVVLNPETGKVELSAVDTVERFQGGERTAILISATESDPDYLLLNGEFLLDPRRLTVALSRAKRKLILVASESVFNLFSADEEVFANTLLWKHLLRRTCTQLLWQGPRAGHAVQVWGNAGAENDKRIQPARTNRPGVG